MADNYDVIVIGAGNGGLAAAATTAKAGLKTLVLEKHNLPGGSASSFVRGRFEFEPSLHELCGVGNEQNPGEIYNLFKKLDAKVDWRYEYNTFRAIVKGPNGYDVKLRSGVENFCEDMEKAVPGCYSSVKAFFDLQKKVDAALAYIEKKKGNPNPLVMIFKHADFLRIASHSADDVLNALGVPEKAKQILGTYWGYLGVPMDIMNCMHYLSMFSGYLKYGAAMPYKRSHELSLAIEKTILDNGGEIWYNSKVTGIIFNEDGSVGGVKLGDREIRAKQVISNTMPDNIYNMASDKSKIPERSKKLANARRLGLSVVTIYVGLDCTKEDLGINDYTVFVMPDGNTRKQWELKKEDSLYIVNCLNEAIPDSSPKGTSTLFFTALLLPEDCPKMDAREYKKFKRDIAEKYISDYEKIQGIDIKSHIEEIEVATPVTFARYLGSPGGTIYGYMTSDWDNILARIASSKEDNIIPGITFAGGHAERGDGYSTSYVTGQMAGNKVIKIIKGGN